MLVAGVANDLPRSAAICHSKSAIQRDPKQFSPACKPQIAGSIPVSGWRTSGLEGSR
ncbi:MAG: hypothetical protein EWM72_00975 [Nitrospira sp.]|nr:MAG: hypothetical protein EWM72_00975 [Nitrospira sp.]